MLHRFSLDTSSISASSESAVIDLKPTHVSDDAADKAAIALKAILTFIGLTPEKDFKDPSRRTDHYIQIIGKTNILIALEMLLTRRDIFELSTNDYSRTHYNYWQKNYNSLIASAINKSLSANETKKIVPLIRKCLNEAYEALKTEPYVQAVLSQVNINENYQDDFLKHPLYQALSYLMDDFDKRSKEAVKKTYPEKSTSVPNKEVYDAIFDKFLSYVPLCFTTEKRDASGYNRISALDADKIRTSRESNLAKNFRY